jgi:hypothetical protein
MAGHRLRSASAAVFCPQNRPPSTEYLQDLRTYLRSTPVLEPFIKSILSLSEVWEAYAQCNASIRALEQGLVHIQQLSNWINNDNADPLVETMSGIVILPLQVIIHLTQYFQYLDTLDITHRDFLQDISIGGAQGLCGGLFAAAALATSANEEELVLNASISLRLALLVGACGELGDDPNNLGSTTVVLRTKTPTQAEDIISRFKGVSLHL